MSPLERAFPVIVTAVIMLLIGFLAVVIYRGFAYEDKCRAAGGVPVFPRSAALCVDPKAFVEVGK